MQPASDRCRLLRTNETIFTSIRKSSECRCFHPVVVPKRELPVSTGCLMIFRPVAILPDTPFAHPASRCPDDGADSRHIIIIWHVLKKVSLMKKLGSAIILTIGWAIFIGIIAISWIFSMSV
jgi:hypothetical protein